MEKFIKTDLWEKDPILLKLYVLIKLETKEKDFFISFSELINKLNYSYNEYDYKQIKNFLEQLQQAQLIEFNCCNDVVLIKYLGSKKIAKKTLKKNNSYIEEIWSKYPIKKGKQVSINKIEKLIKDYGADQIKRAVERFNQEINREMTEKKYIPHGSTFFTTKIYDYLDENFKQNNILTSYRNDNVLTLEDFN